jgi:hypothetical protein
MAHPVVEGFRKEWPAAFAGPSLDKLSGNAVRWSTTQNRRSRGEIPRECFVKGHPTIVLRDKFLDWLDSRLMSNGPSQGGRHPRSARVPDRVTA